jgi:uncharacterized protein
MVDNDVEGENTISMLEAEIQPLSQALRQHGVRRLRVFGSTSRHESRPDSDIDLLVGFSPEYRTLEHLLAVGDLLESALGKRVDLVTEDGLSPHAGPKILREAQDVRLNP